MLTVNLKRAKFLYIKKKTFLKVAPETKFVL